jgi:putative membrane protein
MFLSAILSLLHLLALPLGLAGVFLRGRALKTEPMTEEALSRAFAADTSWGIAAMLWISTGVLRVFFQGKDPEFYVRNGLFWMKVSLFLLVFLMELFPMVTLIRWRVARRKGVPIDFGSLARLRSLNPWELGLTCLIFGVAPFMARGAWLF